MPGLSTWLWPELGFQVWHARAFNINMALAGFKFGMPGLSQQVWHARALNKALARSRVSSLACPGSQHGFGPNLGFMFGMPGLSTGLWPEAGFQVWHARALNMALARTWVSSLACPGFQHQHGFGANAGFKFGMFGLSTDLACPGSQQGFGPKPGFKFGMPGLPTWLWPEPGFHVWHARALNRALVRTQVSSLACPGSQHGFGPNLGFKFGMPGLSTSTWLWCERRFQVWHARALNRFGMPGLPTGLWPEAGFQVWHARAPNMALARTWVSCLACPGSQQGFGPKPDFKFGMPGLSIWLWPELGFQVWRAGAFNINMALVRTQVSSLACPGSQQVWHARAPNIALDRSRVSSLACPGSQHGFGPNLGFMFGMPGLSTGLWPEAGFQVWHARALNMALARTWVSCLACPGSQQGFGPKPDFKFGMPGLSTWLWPELGFQVWHAWAFNINMALARSRISSLACPGFQHQHGFGANAGFKFGMRALNRFGMPGLPTGLWPEAGFQVWHARALNMALARTWVSSLACPGFQHQHGFGANLGFMFGMPGLSTGLGPEAGFQVWHARALNMALARTWVSSLACPGFQHQHGFGANAGFKFGMPGLSTGLACPGCQQGFGPNLGFKFGMPGLPTWPWPEPGFHVWHARALNRALARSRVSSLACPGSQHGFGPNLGFMFGMPGFQRQHGFGANAGFKFGMPGLSTGLACPGSQQGFGPKPGFKFGMPGLSTWLWPEPGFHVWHARALNRALARSRISSLACPGSQHGFGPTLGFEFGMPGLSTSTWLWCERRFQVWHARALNMALVRTQVSSLACPGFLVRTQVSSLACPGSQQVWHARAPNIALDRSRVSSLACPGSQHGLGPNLGFMFGMPGLSTGLWPEAGFQVWHARALNMALARSAGSQHGFGPNLGFKFGVPRLSTSTWLWSELGFQVWHARAFNINMALVRTQVSSLACPGSQQVWHARAPNRALARTWVSSLACLGCQHGLGPNLGFMFGMPGLSTGLWPEAGFQVWHARALNMALARTWASSLACRAFNVNMALVRMQVSSLACPGSQQVWHARAPNNRALARSRVSSLACPGSQHGFGPNLGFMFGMPGLSTGLWPEAGFQVWHARALNMALARPWGSSLACLGFQHQRGFGAIAGFKFGMPGLSICLACPGSQQGFGPKPGFKFGMPGLSTWLWPELGFQVWHARAFNINMALVRTQVSSLACPGSQQGFGPKPDFKFGVPGLSTWLWPELGFQVWHARGFNINMALVRTQVSSLACPGSQQVWHARAPNRALARSRVSSLACPGSQHGFGPNLGFMFSMPGLSTGIWPELGFQVWRARAFNINMALVRTQVSSLACPGSQYVWHARAPSRALARSRVSSLACPGSQHMALARTWVSCLACPGSQQGFGPKPDFKFGMPGFSTWLWPELGFQVWHARAFNINMALVRTQVSSLACPGFQQVWHARAPNRALARSRVSSLACPGCQHGFGPNLGFMFGMPGLSTGLWPEAGFQVWQARALNMALAGTWVSSLACPGFQHQHGFGANAGFKFGMPGLLTGLACPGSQQGFGPKPGFKFGMPGLPTWLYSCLACPGSQQGFGPKPDFKFGMPGLSTWLWPELGFQVWHARAFNINMALARTQVSSLACPGSQQVWHARAANRALARTWVSSLACPGSQHGLGPNLGFMFGMPGLSTGLWPEAGFQVWHARALNMALARTWASSLACRAFNINMALVRMQVSSLACPGSQHGFGPNLVFMFGMPGLWPEAGFQVRHARALNMALARTWVSSLACPGFQHQHGFGANAGFKFGMPGLSTGLACPGSQQGFGPKPDFKFGMPGLSTWLWPEPGFHVWHARALNRALARNRVSSLACLSACVCPESGFQGSKH